MEPEVNGGHGYRYKDCDWPCYMAIAQRDDGSMQTLEWACARRQCDCAVVTEKKTGGRPAARKHCNLDKTELLYLVAQGII